MLEERTSQYQSPLPEPLPAPILNEGRLRSCLTSRFGRDMTDFPVDACLIEGVGLDSLDELELMASLECEFHVSFSADQLAEPKSIRGILKAIDKLNAGGAS